MTKIHPVTVLSHHTTRRHLALTMLLGVSIGAAGVVGAMQYISPAIAANESAIFNGCRPPDVEGAATIWIMRGGKLDCYRYR